MDKYAELRAAVESATPGRWYTKTECQARCCWHVFSQVELCGEDVDTPIVMWKCREADAKFMALARNVLPALLGERDALREVLSQMVDVAERVDGWQSFPQEPINKARAALAQEQGEPHGNQE